MVGVCRAQADPSWCNHRLQPAFGEFIMRTYNAALEASLDVVHDFQNVEL